MHHALTLHCGSDGAVIRVSVSVRRKRLSAGAKLAARQARCELQNWLRGMENIRSMIQAFTPAEQLKISAGLHGALRPHLLPDRKSSAWSLRTAASFALASTSTVKSMPSHTFGKSLKSIKS